MEKKSAKVQVRYFSGYIRNYKALCAELGIEPSLPREAREEAILTAAYEKWGTALVDRLYGAFAIALYDTEKQITLVFRDHL